MALIGEHGRDLENITGGTSAFDVFVSGGTYTAGTATFTNNTGGTFTVTGFTTGSTTGSTTSTASNGLTKVNNDVVLGGDLTGVTSINAGSAYQLQIVGTYSNGAMIVQNMSAGGTALATFSNGGVSLLGTDYGSGQGIKGVSNSGQAGVFSVTNALGLPLLLNTSANGTNNILTAISIVRGTSQTVTTGYGSQITFDLENGSGVNVTSGKIINVYSAATSGAERANMELHTIINGVLTKGFYLSGYGDIVNPTIRTYADDAAADADATLDSKAMYLVTGSRIPHFKP